MAWTSGTITLVSGDISRTYLGKELTLLSAVSAIGAGSSNNLNWEAEKWGWEITPAGFSALNVTLEGSRDGSTWAVIDTSTSIVQAVRHIENKAYKYVRANLNSKTGTGTLTVKVVAKMTHQI